MDTSKHTMPMLFLQLGLPAGPEEIQSFIERHKGLPIPLAEADFWTPAQAEFLRVAIDEDSDWCEVVDELNALLRA